MKSILLATVGLLGLSGSAFAADAVTTTEPAPAPLPVASSYNWSGAYVGAQAGYGWGRSHLKVVANGNYADPDPHGFLGGIYAGYNHQFANNVVLGVEADAAFGDIKGSGPGRFAAGPVFPGVDVSGQSKWTGALRARAGYAVDRWLPYVAGGVAFTKYKVSVNEGGNITGDSRSLTGWTIGAGVEYAFSDRLIGRFDYRYTDFGHKNFARVFDVDLKTHDLRVGIAYKF